MPLAKLKDIKLYYEVHGKGEPLLLITDIAEDIQTWQFTINDLSNHFKLIIFDNIGSGRSDYKEDYSIDQFTDDCIELLDFLKIEKAHVLGHGMGGFIAQDLAIKYPKRLRKLILACTAPYNTNRNIQLFDTLIDLLDQETNKQTWYQNYYYWIHSHKFLEDKKFNDALFQFIVNYEYAQKPKGFVTQMNAIKSFDSSPSLSAITAETLVIIGEEDILVRAKDSEKLYQGITMASYPVFIENCAHSVHTEAPKQFVHTVLSFLYKYNR